MPSSVADLRQMREQPGEGPGEGVVDDDDRGPTMVGDIEDLLGEEPDVQRMEHGAHRRDGQIGGEVLGVVPHEGADPLVAGHAERAQCVR